MPSVRESVQPTTHDACAVCAQVRASSHAESDGVTQRNPSGIAQAGGGSLITHHRHSHSKQHVPQVSYYQQAFSWISMVQQI